MNIIRTSTILLLYVTYRFLPFFFQAEDGIRDFHVTGVQTCALPISGGAVRARPRHAVPDGVEPVRHPGPGAVPVPRRARRSEERRVGKECRSLGSAYHKITGMQCVWSSRER